MKRLCLIAICCLLLGGCTTPEEPTESTESFELSEPHHDDLCSGVGGRTFDSVDEFAEYYNSGKVTVPDTFVHYQQIAKLGKFVELTFMGISYDQWLKGNMFAYTLTDELNRPFILSGYKGHSLPEIEISYVTSADMRTNVSRNVKGVFYSCEDIIYEYDPSGKLDSIVLQAKDAYFIITAEDGFDQFEPNPDGTFVERLLCLESALIAQDEFVEMVSTPYTPENEAT